MNVPVFKTPAEQRLEYLTGLTRPLNDEESDDLRRAMHAVYCLRRRRQLARHRSEELETLRNVEREARQPERYRNDSL